MRNVYWTSNEKVENYFKLKNINSHSGLLYWDETVKFPIINSVGSFFKEGNRDKKKFDEETIKKLI
jgi:hypothetical protein